MATWDSREDWIALLIYDRVLRHKRAKIITDALPAVSRLTQVVISVIR